MVEVITNPTDVGAWIGLAGDTIDLIPFVTCVGETTRALRTADKIVDNVDAVSDAQRIAKKAEKVTDAKKVLKQSERYTPDQDAVLQLAKEYKHGVNEADANTLVEWATEYGINNHEPMRHTNRSGIWGQKLHIKIGSRHIPVI